MRNGLWMGLLAASLMGHSAQTQALQWGEEYAKRIKATEAISPLGDDVFGDRINLFNGTASFSVTDISLPGNSALPVELVRSYDTQDVTSQRPIGVWDLDIPRLSGVHPDRPSMGYWGPPERCSTVAAPPSFGTSPNIFAARDFWSGNRLSTPRGGGDLLTITSDPKLVKPTFAAPVKWHTKDGWFFSCLSALQSGQPGEGFIGHAPDGAKYHFDWMVARDYNGISRKDPSVLHPAYMERKSVRLYPTLIEDRFGNWVRYEWSGGRLDRIHANDGREITLAYAADNGRLVSASAHGRTWTYEYDAAKISLVSVLNPDGSRWRYAFQGPGALNRIQYVPDPDNPGLFVRDDTLYCWPTNEMKPLAAGLTITHPSGAIAQFNFAPMRHGRTHVNFLCMDGIDDDWRTDYNYHAITHDVMSLQSKRITGPGLVEGIHTYSYTSLEGGYRPVDPVTDELTGATPPPHYKYVTVTEPDGTQIVNKFGKDYDLNEGQLLQVDVRKAGSTYRTTVNTYVTETQALGLPFPENVGSNLVWSSDPLTGAVRPVKTSVITENGATYTSTTNTFDAHARSLSVTKSSSPGYGKTDVTAYYDDRAKWLLGQIDTVKDQETSLLEVDNAYDATTAQLTSTKRFGKLQAGYTYHTNAAFKGQLATVTDGRDNETYLTTYKRGIPQAIFHAYGSDEQTVERAVVDDLGQIESTTDENGYVTGYEYDPMGRLKKITYPTGDSTAWNATTISFAPSPAQYGLPAGHWRQIVATGNARKITNYDALWRPRLTREYDTADPEGTARFTVRCYDHEGRETFVSNPRVGVENISCNLTGTRTTYDAIGRARKIEQDSELGVLTTSIDYLSGSAGSYKRIINPRNHLTRIWYQAYDTPSEDWPVKITAPESLTTEITRDDFGKPLTIYRSGTYDGATVQQTRRYVYRPDFNHELCKIIEAETGTLVLGYDEAGNLLWSTAGTNLTSPTECNLVDAAYFYPRIDRSYDAHNRLKSVSYPDGIQNLGYTYWPDGALKTVSAGDITQTYSYNKRRLLTNEHLGWNEVDWNLTWGHDTNGHVNELTYPDGEQLTYSNNALGQARQVASAARDYATGITYHPNGAVKGFTYANRFVHSTTLNTRGLPARINDVYGSSEPLDMSYAYDANGNVADILDNAPGGVQDRGMGYDGLDRLTQVEAPDLWGSAIYRYDPVDNLRQAKLGSRDYRYTYSSGRLSSLRDPAGALIHGYGYDARGNRTARTGQAPQTYTFDAANRLRAADGVASYVYDGHGRRVRSYYHPDSYSFYSQDGRLLFERDQTKAERRYPVYLGNRLIAIRKRADATGDSVVWFQHTDPLGSVVAESSPGRTAIHRNYYEPYGEVTNRTVDGQGYTGHVMDAATGLVYMQQRYYDPIVGRFLSVDPVGADFGNGGNFNRYWYANNNPYKFTDPDGRLGCTGTMIEANCSEGGLASAVGAMAKSARDYDGGEASTVPSAPDPSRVQAPAQPRSIGSKVASAAGDAWEELNDKVLPALPPAVGGSIKFIKAAAAAKGAAGIVASNGTRITGLARHGVHRAIGDGASRAGVRPKAVLDALKNPKKIVEGVDSQGRPFQVFHGEGARVVVNPQTGQIVSMNPLSAAGAH